MQIHTQHIKNLNMEMKGGKFIIRDWRKGDEESVVKHANNINVSRHLRDHFAYPYTMENARVWIERATTIKPFYNYAIEVDSNAVGGIGIMMGEREQRKTFEIGYWLGEEYWGRGIMTEAVKLMTDHVFANFDICRIHACISEKNPASMKVLEKAGYQFEGIMRKHFTKNDVTYDLHIYAMVR